MKAFQIFKHNKTDLRVLLDLRTGELDLLHSEVGLVMLEYLEGFHCCIYLSL